MKREAIPTCQELTRHAEVIPEINPSEVIAMLQIKQAAEDIQHSIIDVMLKENNLSEGRLCALIVLHQQSAPIAPSLLADRIGVSRATISVMLKRLERNKFVIVKSDTKDGRGKLVSLTRYGREYMANILPLHYLRISQLMSKLSEGEQQELINLLQKLTA